MKQSQKFPKHCQSGLICLLLAGSAFMLVAAPTQTVTKDAMLQHMAQKIILPAHLELESKSQTLCASLEQLSQSPTLDSWAKARTAWLATQVAARQIQWLQIGPMADHECLATFYYGKMSPFQIEAMLASSTEIGAAQIENTSAAAKGLFALEYLLFEERVFVSAINPATNQTDLQAIFATNTQQRCRVLLALAQDVHRKATLVAAEWAGTNRTDASAKFVSGGQGTLNTLVNELARNLEKIAEEHLNFALLLPSPVMRQLDRIEGARSSTSLPQLLGMLRGTQRIYLGGEGLGLDDYLSALNQPLAVRIEQQFQKSIAALQAIKIPLETALTEQRESVQRAYEATRNLEILFKVDLASALGVTITFSSNDGD